MLRSAPTGVQWQTVPFQGATQDEQDAELTNILWRVSDTIDSICNQPLRATIDTEEESGPDYRITVEPNGVARMIASQWPILSIVSAKVSPAIAFPRAWTTIPTDQLDVEYTPLGQLNSAAPNGAGAGPSAILVAPQYVNWFAGRRGFRLSVTYINGWPHTSLTAAATTGSSTLAVDDTTGWVGVQGTISDGASTETVHVTAIDQTSGPGNLTLSTPTRFFHDRAVLTTSLPGSIQWAAIVLAMDEVRLRGTDAIMIPSQNGGLQMLPPRGSLMKVVNDILQPYSRVI